MGKQNNKPNRIQLSQDDIDNAEQKSLEQASISFFNNTKTSTKGIGDMLSTPSRIPVQGRVRDNETHFIDMSKFSNYLFPEKKGDYAFPFEADIERERALKQSNWEQTKNAALKILPNATLEFIGMLGNLLDLEDYANSNDEIGNWLNTWKEEQKAKVNEALPIYRENPTEHLDIGDYAWWMESGSALVESAAAFVGLGYLTGAGLSRLFSGGGKALEWLGAIGKGVRHADSVKKGTHAVTGLLNTLMLNQAEGIGIATDVYNRAYQEKLEELIAEGIDEETAGKEAKLEASQKAAASINFNRINMLLNLTSSFAFLKQPTSAFNKVKLPSMARTGRRIVEEGFQEMGEELINLLAEKQAFDNHYSIDDAIADITSKEGIESGLLGFIGGAMQTGMTNAGRVLKTQRTESGERISRNDAQSERFYKQEEAKKRWEGLSAEEKINDVTDVYFKTKDALNTYNELQKAIAEGNTTRVKALKDMMLSNQAYDAFSTGTTQDLIDVFKGIQKLTPEEAKAKGLDEASYISDSQKAIDTVTILAKEYNKAQNYLDSYSVYNNRAVNTFLKDNKSKLNTALIEEEKEVLSDLADLGIEESAITFENGKVTIEGYKDLPVETKKTIKNLESVITVENLYKQSAKIDADLNSNTEEYGTLISDEYQEEIRSKITEQTKLAKEQAKKRKKEEALAKKAEKSKKEKTKRKTEGESEKTKEAVNDSISSEEFNLFKDTGEVTEDRLNNIAEKIKSNQELNEKELLILKAKSTEIEALVTGETKSEKSNTQDTGESEKPPTAETPPNPPNASSKKGFDFGIGEDSQQEHFLRTAEKNSNQVYVDNRPIEKKLEWFNKVLNDVIEFPDSEFKSKMIIQYKQAIRNLEEKQAAEATTNEQESAAIVEANKNIEDLASLLEEDNTEEEQGTPIDDDKAPKVEDDDDKVVKKVKLLLNALEALDSTDIDTTSFKDVASYMENLLGKDRFIPLFNSFKDVYNLTNKSPERITGSYEDYFLTSDEKIESATSEAKDLANTHLLDLYYMSKDDYQSGLNNIVKNYLLAQGFSLYTGDSAEFEGLKTVYAPTALAHLDRKYNRDVNVYTTDRFNNLIFNISKSDVDNKINQNTSTEVLDFDILNAGEKITLQVLDRVVYDDGSIAYADGRIEKNGELLSEDKIENAPIGVVYKGKVLKGLYLHTPSWINEETIADPDEVERQRDTLRAIREAILNSKNQALTTTITERSNGHILFDSEGEMGTVKDRIPNVTLAIAKDNNLLTDETTVIARDLKAMPEVINGHTYAVFPVNKGVNMAFPIYPAQLKERAEIVNSMLNAVRMYLDGDIDAPLVKSLYEQTGINITTIAGLRKYMSKFVYLNPNLAFEFNGFKAFVDSSPEYTPIIRIAGENLEFGMGAGIGGDASFINKRILNEDPKKREFYIKGLMDKLKRVLEESNLNIDKKSFNKEFDFPIITDTEVTNTVMPYNDFVKSHTYTYQFSTELENGKTIYTVQSNLIFDNTLTGAQPIKEESKEDTPTPTPVDTPTEVIPIKFGNLTLNLDMNVDIDKAPKLENTPQNPELANSVYEALGFDTNTLSYAERAKKYKEFGITKSDGTEITEQDIEQNPTFYQNNTNQSTEEFVASEKTIRDLAARMSDRIGIPVRFESDRSKNYKGKLENGTAVVNLAYATLDTPIHEILGHPIIRAIKNNKVKDSNYVHTVGTINFNKGLKNNQLYENLLKELEYGKGKEVFDRVKRDYVNKEFNKEEITKLKQELIDFENDLILWKDNSTYLQRTKEKIRENNERIKFLQKNDGKYTLEEQQEEAIVELVGLYTADKLDAVKDGKLISLLKRLLKEMKAFMKSLIGQKEVDIDKLPDDMTLGDIADLLAYSNSKLILPGNEVVYTTPDNQQFKTYQEASNHISELAKNVEDVDLDNVILKDKNKVDKIEEIPVNDFAGVFEDFIKVNGKWYNQFIFEPNHDYSKDTPVSNREIIAQWNARFDDVNEYSVTKGGLDGFIEKNKEYEQSREIIEEWKKENNIQYDPEEVYSRGQGFYSSIGAYSNLELDLLLKNLIQHIQDNKKAGGEFTISAFTKPIDRRLRHIEGTGDRVRFVIYPKSEHIKWAAPTDVYSGSVWDAHEKVSKDKKSELLGVSFTKAPALRNINEVSPNLADIIDNLSHVHNELGIELTTDNFRIEYDDNIDYSTKKLINNINSILDQKYGKLVKPEVKQKEFGTKYIAKEESAHGDFKTTIFNTEKEALEYKKSMAQYDDVVVRISRQVGIQPTQTKENTTSIENVKSKFVNPKLNDWRIIPGSGGKDMNWAVEYRLDDNADIEFFDTEQEARDFINSLQNKKVEEKEYTSQAEINLKIAALKEVARKYPRSLITSKVVPINPNMVDNSEIQYSKVGSNQNVNYQLKGINSEVDLAPKILDKGDVKIFKDTTPSTLFIQGVSLPLQNDIIDYLTYNIIKDAAKNQYGNLSFDYIGEYYKTLKAAREAYYNTSIDPVNFNNKQSLEKRVEIVDAIIENYGLITNMVLDKLRTFNNIKVNGKNIEILKAAILERGAEEDFDMMVLINDSEDTTGWMAEAVFMEDVRDKMSYNLRNFLSSIEDVTGFTMEGENRIPILRKSSFLGMVMPIAFDHVFNEISGILAYSNQQESTTVVEPTIDSMLEILEEWVDTKPFLHNVIEQLKNADEKVKNEFVGVMSKHYTNHMYLYQDNKGRIKVRNSDNSAIIKIIQNGWYSNIVQSNIVNINENKEYVVDTDVVDSLIRRKDELLVSLKANEPLETVISLAHDLLEDMGMPLSKGILTNIQKNGIQYAATPYALLHLFANSDGAFKIYLDRLNTIKGKLLEENHPFADNTALNKFTRVIAKYNTVYFANSFRDVRGRMYWSYSQNKFLIDRIKSLKTDDALLTTLINQPFSKDSEWVKALYSKDSEFLKYFQYFTLDGLKTGNRGKKADTFSPAEYEQSKVALFFSQLQKGNKYIINLYYPTTSNKDIQYGIRVLGTKWSDMYALNNNVLTSEMLDNLYTALVKPEVNRIRNVQANPDSFNLKGYKEGGQMFNIIPTLNANRKLWDEDGVLKDIELDSNLKIEIKKELQIFVRSLLKDKIAEWKELGFTEDFTDTIYPEGQPPREVTTTINTLTGNNVVHDATDFVLNYLTANVNIMQTFTTDPAIYWKSNHWKDIAKELNKNEMFKDDPILTREEAIQYYTEDDWIQEHEDLFDNLGKRLAGDVAPGNDIPDSPNNTFRTAVVADDERESYMYEYFKALLGNKSIPYKNVNATDAQEFTTLKEHLYLMNKEGIIDTKEMNRLLKIDKKGEDFTTADFATILQPMKPVYVNNLVSKEGIEFRVYIKSSSFPLFKALTKGQEIDKVRIAMERDKVDRIAFESAVKIGGVAKPSPLFNSTGNVLDKIEFSMLNDGALIPRSGFKIQQNLPYHESQTINHGSQQIKLLTASFRGVKGFKIEGKKGDFTGQEIQDEVDATYNKIYDLKYKAFITDIGYDPLSNTISNIAKLQEILMDDALRRKYSLYEVEGLRMNDDGEFYVPLWLSGITSKIEPLLNSIIDNNIRKFKPKGQSFILGTSSGFTPIIQGKGATKYMKNNSGIVYDKAWVESFKDGEQPYLRPMRKENGKIMPDEVIIPFKITDVEGNIINLKDYVKNGFIDFAKIDPKLLEAFGFRIPTQNPNSMTYFKVVGFLPKESGDLMLAPSEWTVRMGSDFDIDKLYANLYNITYDPLTKNLSRYEGDEELFKLEDYLLDLHIATLSNPSNAVQKEIARALTFGKLIDKDADTDLVREIYPLIQQRGGERRGIGISEQYQSKKYRNARAGNLGVAIFSNDSTFNALLRGKNIYLQVTKEKKTVPYRFRLAGYYSNSMSDARTIEGGFKSEVIEAFQSLSVDNENEQGLHKLHINKHTFDAIKTLMFHGMSEEVIAYFINQPIIRRYVELIELAEDSITPFTYAEVQSTINKEFPNTGMLTLEDDLNISLEAMKQNLALPLDQLDTSIQQYFLEQFLDFERKGKIIKSLQSSINTDSAGIGKDLFYANEKQNQVLALNTKSNVANAHELIGEYLTLFEGQGEPRSFEKGEDRVREIHKLWYNKGLREGEKRKLVGELIDMGYMPVTTALVGGRYTPTISFIKPTTINGFASVYALLLNNKLWEKYFPYNNPTIKASLASIARIINRPIESIADKAANDKIVFNSIKSYSIANVANVYTVGNLQEERQRLLMDTKDNMSLGTILDTVIKEGKISNAFVNRLTIDLKKEVLFTNIEYKASAAENVDERAVYAAFSHMFTDETVLGVYNGIEYTVQRLAQELVTHQLLTGGVQKANQFIKYIPINYLKLIGFYESMEDINFSNEDDFNSRAHQNQYLQHNPKDVLLNEERFAVIDAVHYKFYNNSSIIRALKSSPIKLPKVFSIKNPDTVKGYNIYFYNKQSKQWEQKDTLGHQDILEYTPNMEYGTTGIPKNRAPIITPVSVPVGEVETKQVLSQVDNSEEKGKVIYDPESQDIIDTYNLNEADTSQNKMATILEKIVEHDFNPFSSYVAQELLNNISKISEYDFIVDTNLADFGNHSYKDKTIKINPTAFDTKQEFENVVLEEIIHAFTKKAILENKTGEVLRLKALRNEAIDAVKEYYGEEFAPRVEELKRKLTNGEALTSEESDILYPLINDTEFIGRLFKSQGLQQILNNKESAVDGQGILSRIWEFVKSIFDGLGFNIKDNSVLAYALTDVISLIQQPSPSPSLIQGIKDLKNTIRTKEFIEARFALRDDNGDLASISNAEEVAQFINENITNLIAKASDNKVYITSKTQRTTEEAQLELELEIPTVEPVKLSDVELFPGVFANEEQKEALNVMNEFLASDKTAFILQGRGGTGKTTIIKKLLENRGALYLAPTHKAKNILQQSVKTEVNTVASALFIDMDESTGKFSPNEFKRNMYRMPIKGASIIIIDEASMLSDDILREIKTNMKPNAKIIFMADKAQLPPVGQEHDSLVFSIKETYTLQTRMRQGIESPIVPLSDIIADNVLSKTPQVSVISDRTSRFDVDKNKGTLFLNSETEFLQHFINDYNINPQSTKIVTFNNQVHNSPQSVQNMNRKVRALMFSDLDKYNKGEQLMSYSNIMSSTGEVIIGNSEDFTIVNTFTPFKSKLDAVVESRAKGRRAATVTFEAVTVMLKNNITGKLREVSIPTQKGKQEVKTQLAEFWKKDPQMGFKFSSIIPDFEFAYAITSHKSQGSTYVNSYVLEDNILGGTMRSAKQKNQSLYVAVSRASDKVVVQSLNNPVEPLIDKAPSTKSSKAAIVLKGLNNRIATLESNIEKAKQKEEFEKVAFLQDRLDNLTHIRNQAITSSRLRDIVDIGNAEMQELSEIFNNQMSIEDTLYARKTINFWKSAIDALFNEEEKESRTLIEAFKQLEADAIRFENKLEVIENAYIEKLLKQYGTNMSVEEIFYHFKDINNLQSQILDISRSDNALLNAIFLHVKNANIEAMDEIEELLSELDDMETKVRRGLKGRGDKELFDVFRQRTADGNLTGHLVNRYSHQYFIDRSRVKSQLRDVNNYGNYNKLFKWAKANTEAINLEYLFPNKPVKAEEKVLIEQYKNDLKARIGEEHYNEYIREQGKLIENFNNSKAGYLAFLYKEYNVDTTKELFKIKEAFERYNYWIISNSPYAFYRQYSKDNANAGGKAAKYNAHQYVRFIPTNQNYLDDNFKSIEENKDLLEFYNYFNRVDNHLKQFMTQKDRTQLSMNGLPHFNKILLDQYKDKGMKAGILPIYDAMKDSVRRGKENVQDYSNKDPITETEDKKLNLYLTSNNGRNIEDYITRKTIEYKLANEGEAPTKEMKTAWKEEIVDLLSQKKNYNLPKVLKMYALTVIAYKHKAAIEDSIKLAQNVFHRQREYTRTSDGTIKTNPLGNAYESSIPSESFKNTKKQLDYFVQSFYGKNKQDEGITTTKVYTSEEKKTLKELNDLLLNLEIQYKAGNVAQDTYTSDKQKLEAQIDNVGGVAVWSKRGDALLKYVQLKGMGWNLMSAIANVGFALVSNYVEASGGQLYTTKQLNKAYRMVMGSVVKNASFNKYEAGEAKKIRSLMDRWDVLKDSSKELFETPLSIVTNKKTEWLAPYNLTQRTEYVNQAPIMIAMMLNTKIQTAKGEINMWEAFDEDGKWKDEYGAYPNDTVNKLRIKIDQINKMNHGNYDPNSPLAIKNKFLGRAISQFRSWMFEGFATRFEGEKYDAALELTRKGRYVSLVDYYKQQGVAGASVGIVKGLLKNASFGLLFKGLDFNSLQSGNFSETDAANIRKVVTEMVMYMSLYSTYLLLSSMVRGLDDEEDKYKKYVLNTLINQGLRLKTDMLFYISPGEFKNLLRDLLPVTTVITDSVKWLEAVSKFVQGEDEIGSGVYSGHSRLLRATSQMLPLGTQIYKNINYSVQTFD